MFKFSAFLTILLNLVFGITGVTLAFGVDDFVSVADGNSNVINNSAGLTKMQGRNLNLEHRLTERNLANLLFWYDDLLVYNAPGTPGDGSLYVAYNQDQISDTEYQHIMKVGYAYGWSVSESIALGIVGNYANFSITSPIVGGIYGESGILVDLGALVEIFTHCQLGINVKNALRTQTLAHFELQTTAGISYQLGNHVVAVEIDDLLNQVEQSVYRAGIRLGFNNLKLHIIWETDTDIHQGITYGLEYLVTQHVELGLWQYSIQNANIRADLLQFAVGYKF